MSLVGNTYDKEGRICSARKDSVRYDLSVRFWFPFVCFSSFLYWEPLPFFAVSREDLGEIYFFTGTENLSGEWDYSKSPKVALAPSESSYGYILSLPTNDPAMITDILTLPKSPENWGLTPIKEGDFGYIGKTISFSKDLRTMFIKEKVFPNKDKRHVNQLEVAKGDPPGRYSWTVLVDGQYLDTGNFQLVLTGGALASIPTEKDVAQLMQKLKQIKGEARGLSSACLETDWGPTRGIFQHKQTRSIP